MESILVINTGSTSLKYSLFTASRLEEMQSGNIPFSAGSDAVQKAFKQMLRSVGDISGIIAVGHRVVHGGEVFYEPCEMGEREVAVLEKFADLAPLHNPINVACIRAAQAYLPGLPNIAVFDTSWFRDLPFEVREYPIPEEVRERWRIRRYGFHGISHAYAVAAAARELGKKKREISCISLHLGGGCSAVAVQRGKPQEVSMGFTPLEGLVMQTRSGDIDPGLVLFLAEHEGIKRTHEILYFSSGLSAIAGISDFQKILKRKREGDERAKAAFRIFVRRITKYVGAYAAVLGRVHALVFTGNIGAGDPVTRNEITRKVRHVVGDAATIVVSPNEERAIAEEVKRIIRR